MKKLMTSLLSLGMVLLGTAPVLAAGQTLNAVPAARDAVSATIELSVPVPDSAAFLGDEALEEVEGEGVAGLVLGAVVGFVSGALVGGVTAAVASYATKGHVDWNDVKVGAVAGGAGMAVRGAIRGAIVGP